uniref:Uncharacterized protein n=1 Tax=Triticum urartu TaxID=4572 RepID=A0A8R7V2W4_TRIUA
MVRLADGHLLAKCRIMVATDKRATIITNCVYFFSCCLVCSMKISSQMLIRLKRIVQGASTTGRHPAPPQEARD